MKFTLEDTAEIQKVEMKDEVPTGLLIINKNGEFLDKVTLLDNVKGTVEHLFEYVTGSLSDVAFDVFAAEDIKAADGVSEDYFKADEKVGTITTDSNGIAQMGDLPAGKILCEGSKKQLTVMCWTKSRDMLTFPTVIRTRQSSLMMRNGRMPVRK